VRARRHGLALTAVSFSRQAGTTREMGAYVAKAKPSTGASQTDSAIEQRWAAGCRAPGDHHATVGKQRWIDSPGKVVTWLQELWASPSRVHRARNCLACGPWMVSAAAAA
jgi:hypothetical protein